MKKIVNLLGTGENYSLLSVLSLLLIIISVVCITRLYVPLEVYKTSKGYFYIQGYCRIRIIFNDLIHINRIVALELYLMI